MFYSDPWCRRAAFHSYQQPSVRPRARCAGHKQLGRGRCSPRHRQAVLYLVEFVPLTHSADTPLRNTSGGPRTVERNQNTEQEVIVQLSSFSEAHNHMNVVPSIVSDLAPREGWKLGTQVSSCSVMDPHAPHLDQ